MYGDLGPLQNRVTPFGDIVAFPQRGTFVGNRGIIHDPATKTLLGRRWTTKAWLVCVLHYKGRRREVMKRRSWTELFFLDEAIALAAVTVPVSFVGANPPKRFAPPGPRGEEAMMRPVGTLLPQPRRNKSAPSCLRCGQIEPSVFDRQR
jgi:hypothetical protein